MVTIFYSNDLRAIALFFSLTPAPPRAADDSRDKLERGSDITCDFEKVTPAAVLFYCGKVLPSNRSKK
jgi:hypothetical protein